MIPRTALLAVKHSIQFYSELFKNYPKREVTLNCLYIPSDLKDFFFLETNRHKKGDEQYQKYQVELINPTKMITPSLSFGLSVAES